MKRGEIRWYKFRSPDKRSPVLILTRDSILEYPGETTIAPIASTVRDIPSEVFLSGHDGMRKECVVNLDHIQTVSKGQGQVENRHPYYNAIFRKAETSA